MTYDEIIERVRELRLKRDQADAALLLFLVEVEQEHIQVLRDAGCDSFAAFVQEFVKPSRYEAFRDGLARLGDTSLALRMGSEAVIAANHLTNGSAKYVAAIEAWVDDKGGVLPTRETANKLLRQVDSRDEIPAAVRRQSELAKLRDRVAKLEAENRQLRAQIAKLEGKKKHTTQPTA